MGDGEERPHRSQHHEFRLPARASSGISERVRPDQLERFDKAASAFAAYVHLGRGSVAFLITIFAGHILGTELSGGSVYWPAIIWNALVMALLVFPVLAVCFFLLMYTEVSKVGILYTTLVTTTLVNADASANDSGMPAPLLITAWALGFAAIAYAYRKMRVPWS